MIYYYTFEAEYGLEMGEIEANSLKEATKKLLEDFPEDEGSDGFWTYGDGEETPINW